MIGVKVIIQHLVLTKNMVRGDGKSVVTQYSNSHFTVISFV